VYSEELLKVIGTEPLCTMSVSPTTYTIQDMYSNIMLYQ